MSAVHLIPVALSLLLLGAHCLRLGLPALVTIPMACLLLLFWPRPWVPRVVQALLVLGGLEWIRAALVYIGARQDLGLPWQRLALILGGVALFTLLSSQVFRSRTLRRRYGLD